MPEGHTLHRLARTLREHFAGRAVSVSSPQGRFAESARLIDQTVLVGTDVWGKHLFIEFAGDRFVHVHLGLYGKFDVYDGAPPDPLGQVRMRLVVGGDQPGYADLRGATICDLVSDQQRHAVAERVGPDPLRADAHQVRAWERIRRSRAPLGVLLMDQTVLGGVGNVYRAELLFRHRMHPLRPGNTLRSGQFAAMWSDLVELMELGVATGQIDTVRPEHTLEAKRRGSRSRTRGGEVYVYRRQGQPCHVCGARIRTEVLAARNLFWCPRCQPRFRSRASER